MRLSELNAFNFFICRQIIEAKDEMALKKEKVAMIKDPFAQGTTQ